MGISRAFPPFPRTRISRSRKAICSACKLREKRHAHPRLQKGPEHEALPGAFFVGGVEKPVDLRGRQAVNASRRSLRGREAHLFSGLGDEVLRLVVRVAAIAEDLRDAANVALAIVVRARRAVRTGAVEIESSELERLEESGEVDKGSRRGRLSMCALMKVRTP